MPIIHYSHAMKYSDEQLKTMLTSYFAKVAELEL